MTEEQLWISALKIFLHTGTVQLPANSEEDEEAGEGEHDDKADDLSGAAAESNEGDRDAAKARDNDDGKQLLVH